MKKTTDSLLTLLLTLLAVLALAATPAAGAKVAVRLHTPPPGRLGIEDLWWVQLTALTDVDTMAWFEGFVSEARAGLVFSAKSNQFRLKLARGERRTIRQADIQVKDPYYKPGYEAFYLRSGTVPEGDYTYWVILQPDLGGDTGTSRVVPPGQPRLTGPRDGAVIREKLPMFSWMPPMPDPDGTTYRLTVVEILPGQTKEEAIRSNRPWFVQDKLGRVNLRYPIWAQTLKDDARFAWQVEAASGRGLPAQSEVFAFRHGVPLPPGCHPTIDWVRLGEDPVILHSTVRRSYGRGLRVEFAGSCGTEGCGIRNYYWRATEPGHLDQLYGIGTGSAFNIPPLGAPRTYSIVLTVECRTGGYYSSAFDLHIVE